MNAYTIFSDVFGIYVSMYTIRAGQILAHLIISEPIVSFGIELGQKAAILKIKPSLEFEIVEFIEIDDIEIIEFLPLEDQ